MPDKQPIFEIIPGKNGEGKDIFSVVVKRTYRISGGRLERCDADQPLRKIDQYYDNGDPSWATVQYEYELAPFKPAVDVVVTGKACAPGGKPVPRTNVGVRVGEREKVIAVIGDRECRFRDKRPPLFSEPKPFTDMAIRYENAYGGKDERSDPQIPLLYPRNFLGKGIALRNVKEVIEGLPLPNLEDPADLLAPERVVVDDPRRWFSQPLPQGLGWFPRIFYPRTAYVGAFPPFLDVGTVTKEEAAGMLPANHIALAKQFRLPSFDARFHNGASMGLTFDRLKKNEKFTLRGLTPEGFLEFTLPDETPAVSLDLGTGPEKLEPRLDTVAVRSDDMEVDLLWRACKTYPGYAWLPQMTELKAVVDN